jgi:hypothetical protein
LSPTRTSIETITAPVCQPEVQLLISVVNHTKGLLKDEAVQVVIRAVNRQIAHDFEPYWNISAELRLEGPASRPAL